MNRTEYQIEAVNSLLETASGRQRFTQALVPSLRRRRKIDIVKMLRHYGPLLRPGLWRMLARVLYAAAKQSGVRIVDELEAVPSAEWVEEWIAQSPSPTL